MKKITSLILVSVLAAGSVFAQIKSPVKNPVSAPPAVEQNQPSSGRKTAPMMNFKNHSGDPINDTVIIGTVKSVNTKAGVVKVFNADNREIEVTVTPFTKIAVRKSSPHNQGNKHDKKDFTPDTINDIRAGAWVKITTYRTDTKVLSAAKIAVINQ